MHERVPWIFGISLGVWVLGAAALGAQEPVPPGSFGESIDVRVVNVEAVVTDGKGEPVRGLVAGDLRLKIDGREVPIEYFTEVAAGKAVSAGSAGSAGSQAPVTAGEAVGRSYLVYIDEAFSLANIRDQALANLERDLPLLGPGDRMAVLAFDGSRLDVLSGWTADAAALAAALKRARERPANGGKLTAQRRSLQRDVDVLLENEIDDGDTNPLTNTVGRATESLAPRISPEARTQLGRTAPAVAAALRGFETPPGRKVMLLLSGAWSMSVAPQLYAPLVEAANRLGYTIYPVDTAQSDSREVSALGLLAERTGGRVVVSARLDPFREVVADTGSYYWLGFTPAWKGDDRGHRVEVESRRAGLKVRARGGFADLSKRTESAMKAESALLFGGAPQDRRLIVQLGEPKRVEGGQVEIPVTLGVPVESLALTPQGDGYVAETPLAIAALDAKEGRADLPAARLKVALKTPPKAGTYARFQTAVRIRELRQRLVFSVQDPVNGTAIWGEGDYQPGPGR